MGAGPAFAGRALLRERQFACVKPAFDVAIVEICVQPQLSCGVSAGQYLRRHARAFKARFDGLDLVARSHYSELQNRVPPSPGLPVRPSAVRRPVNLLCQVLWAHASTNVMGVRFSCFGLLRALWGPFQPRRPLAATLTRPIDSRGFLLFALNRPSFGLLSSVRPPLRRLWRPLPSRCGPLLPRCGPRWRPCRNGRAPSAGPLLTPS